MNKTLEELQKELETVEQKLEQVGRESAAYSGAALNPAGDIGGIRSRSRRQKDRIWEKRRQIAKEVVRLTNERRRLSSLIANKKLEPQRTLARVTIMQVLRTKLKKGDQVECMYGTMIVKRINKKSVTVENPESGFTDRLSWNAIKPVRWKEMYQEWKAENE